MNIDKSMNDWRTPWPLQHSPAIDDQEEEEQEEEEEEEEEEKDDDDDNDDDDDDDSDCCRLLFRRCNSFETNAGLWFIGPLFIRNDLRR